LSIHNLQFIISLDSQAILIFYWAIYLAYYFLLPCFKGWFDFSVIAHVSQPYSTIGLIIVYIFSFVFFEPALLVHFNIFILTCKILFLLYEIFQRLCTC
jgi:hypothetical protein